MKYITNGESSTALYASYKKKKIETLFHTKEIIPILHYIYDIPLSIEKLDCVVSVIDFGDVEGDGMPVNQNVTLNSMII
jgi:hypothetical protein